jgi:hypothetical protein
METALSSPECDPTSASSPVAVAAFFETLRSEHERLLVEVRRAASQLDDGGQLGALAANHIRLTQRFFDAQRGILRRRAAADAEVARIRHEAEAAALAMISAAQSRAAAIVASGGTVAEDWSSVEVDIAGLAGSIEDDVRLGDAVGVDAHRQLGVLLDEWWTTEQRECRDRLDDATARATMMQHLVDLEAQAIGGRLDAYLESVGNDVVVVEPADIGTGSVPSGPDVLPDDLLAMLAAADPAQLEALLGSLLEQLAPTGEPAAPEAASEAAPESAQPSDGVIIRLDRAPGATDADALHDSFWATDAQRATAVDDRHSEPESTLHWAGWRVLVPMTAISAVMSVVLAWVG